MGDGDLEWGIDAEGEVVAPDRTIARALSGYRRELLLYVDVAGHIVAGDGLLTRSLGYELGDHAGSHIGELVHPDDLARVFEVVEWARRTDPPFQQVLTARARHRDGTWVPFRAEVISTEPPLRGVVVRCRPLDSDDVEFVGSDARFASLADVVPAGILTADFRGFVVFANEAAAQLLGLDADEVTGHGWEGAVVPDDRPEVAAAARRVLRGGAPEQLVVQVDRLGDRRWMHVTLVGLGAAEHRSGWLATFQDVTERRQAAAELAHQATHDHLTGLPNRLLLEDRLAQAIARIERGGGRLTVLLTDLDDFKAVNDRHGHAAGDAVLVEVADRMRSHLREVDTLVRLGGDELVVLCEGLSDDEVRSLVDRLRSAVAEPMVVGGGPHRQGMSVGWASADRSLDSADLLERADRSMYRDKAERRAEGA